MKNTLLAEWECVVAEPGDVVGCDAFCLSSDEREYWLIEVPGNKWEQGHVFYVLRGNGGVQAEGGER
jgi:hypothetical protein